MSVIDQGHRPMNLTQSPGTPAGRADLDLTRRRFLFAREQLAAQTSSEHYLVVRDMSRRANERAFAETAERASL
jgi:hypothetical protein